MIGLTYLRLKDKENAKVYFEKTVNYDAVTNDDREVSLTSENFIK